MIGRLGIKIDALNVAQNPKVHIYPCLNNDDDRDILSSRKSNLLQNPITGHPAPTYQSSTFSYERNHCPRLPNRPADRIGNRQTFELRSLVNCIAPATENRGDVMFNPLLLWTKRI